MAKEKEEKRKKVCEKCGGTGFVFTEKGLEPEPCECRNESLLKQRLAAAGIPPKYKNKTIDSFTGGGKRKELREDAKAYVKGFQAREGKEHKRGLLYIGITGCGKTHLATGILKAVIDKGYTGYFCNVVDFFARMRDTYSGDTSYDEMDMIDKVSKVDLLVLDDLGAEKPSEWMSDRLYTLINRRYESNLPLIVTTNKKVNLETPELENHVGRRIVSRLCEMCQIVDIFPKEDYRMKGLDLQEKSDRKK